MTVEQEIETLLSARFTPLHLDIANESHMHSVAPNSETHFRVVLVSDFFVDKRKVARHQSVYETLAAQLAGPVHALALHTYTPDEWTQRNADAPSSPDCLGGSKHDQARGPTA